jgi:uncharacterized protein YtpQ (UPF0354 family)
MAIVLGRRWRRALFLFLAVLAASPGSARAAGAVPEDPAGFTAFVAELFQRAMPDATISIKGPLQLVIKSSGDSATDLSHPYEDCGREWHRCRAIVNLFVNHMAAALESMDAPIERSALRIVVRPLAYLDKQRSMLPKGAEPVAAPLPGGFCMMWAVDKPTAIELLSSRDLEPLGLTAEEALAIGRKNLVAALRRQLKKGPEEMTDTVGLMTGNPYESSLFAMPELWAPYAAAMGGDLLVAVPAPDVILVAAGGDPGAAGRVAKRARKVMASVNRPFTDMVFRWSAEGWQPAEPGR